MKIDRIEQELKDVKVTVEPCKKSEEYTMVIQTEETKKYLFSKYHPRKDAIATIDEQKVNKETIWIVLGLGLGYLTESILTQIHENVKIIIIEPTEESVEKQKPFLSPQIKNNPNITLVTGYDYERLTNVLNHKVKMKDTYNVQVVANATYLEFYIEFYKEIVRILTEHLQFMMINSNTISGFATTHIENIMRNREAIKKSYDLTAYKDKYTNIPALIVSAGPSLAKNISYLRDFKGVIFTGGRTLGNVLEEQVRPHFLVSMDPGVPAHQVLREYAVNDMKLIAPTSTQHRVVADNSGKQFFVEETFFEYANRLLGIELPYLDMGGSVATLCLSSAYYMGCNPIIFIGQDLAMTGFKEHVDGKNVVLQNSEDITYVEGYDGEMVPSKIDYILFTRWIEGFIQSHEDREYINATEGGARIKGTKQLTFNEVNEQYTEQYAIEDYDEKYVCKEDIESKIQEVIKELKEGIKAADKGVELSIALQKEYIQYLGKRQDKIQHIQYRLTKEADTVLEQSNEIINGVFLKHYRKEEMKLENKEPLKETLQEKYKRITNRSIQLYTSLSESLKELVEALEKNI